MQFKNTLATLLITWGIASALPLAAQSPPGALRVQVLDPSGAAVVDAVVLVTSAAGKASATQENRNGLYEVKGLEPGLYSVQVTAAGFAPFQQKDVAVTAGKPLLMDVSLQLAIQQEEVRVEGEAPNVSVNPDSNVSSISIKGEELESLSDDPEELASDLQALAGPAAGPSGGQIYIDGFSDGRLPPKSAIREIRVNQNPFSAQYNELGYGRIEIFTKPGADKFHGQASIGFNQSALNSRNPFVLTQPPYHSERITAEIGGPLSKKASVYFNFERRNITDTAIINAVVLDPNFNPISFSEAVRNPRMRNEFSPRIDYQISPSDTLTVRYQGEFNDEKNNGIGLFALPTQATDETEDEHVFQVSETHIFGSNIVNETRYHYQHQRTKQSPFDFSPTIRVLSSFTGGGNNDGTSDNLHSHHELQNYTSISRGKHIVKAGGRLRVITDTNDSNSDFNGTFTFGSLDAYRITELGLQEGLTPAQIRAMGGGADQFLIVTGIPRTHIKFADLGLYLEDDWRLRHNLSLSAGVRYETQNVIHDRADFAPRVSIAWGIDGGKSGQPKTVLRAGFGMFYDRFGRNLIMQAARLNGLNLEQFVVPLPDFYPSIPDPTSITGSVVQPTTYRIDPSLSSPYLIQSAFSLERQLSTTTTASVTYVNTQGRHQLMTRNINAPLPGTYDPANPASGTRPFGNIGNLYEYEAAGFYRQNQLITNFNIRGMKRLTLFGTYVLNYARGNTAGASSFPLNQYDLRSSYGRSQFDMRHRAFLGGSLIMPRNMRLNPFVVMRSGMPFDFTLGRDLNGDSIFNDRPAIATDLTSPTVVQTPWGAFDSAPIAGEPIVQPNYGPGPSLFVLNVRFSKVFGFGKTTETNSGGASGGPRGGPRGGRRGGGLGARGLSGGGGPGPGMWGDASTNHRYNLTLSVFAHNIFNIVNLAPPIGNLSSPLFGQSNALSGGGPFPSQSANRRIMFQVMFSF
ncbi:MAG: TonB-dependent receptor [Acidobacteria bacterium]|nr:TonB-dependent receptor [Acidobacteriota bacterium]